MLQMLDTQSLPLPTINVFKSSDKYRHWQLKIVNFKFKCFNQMNILIVFMELGSAEMQYVDELDTTCPILIGPKTF